MCVETRTNTNRWHVSTYVEHNHLKYYIYVEHVEQYIVLMMCIQRPWLNHNMVLHMPNSNRIWIPFSNRARVLCATIVITGLDFHSHLNDAIFPTTCRLFSQTLDFAQSFGFEWNRVLCWIQTRSGYMCIFRFSWMESEANQQRDVHRVPPVSRTQCLAPVERKSGSTLAHGFTHIIHTHTLTHNK